MQPGRKEIYTDVAEVNKDNVISVLQKAMIDFIPNSTDCEELLKYEKGMQPKIREKKYRKDIDCWCVDNIANEISQFKIDFGWGNPITLVQRGEIDSGATDEATAICLLNEYYDSQNIKKKTQELARFVEICGIGFTIIDINSEWEDGESPFTINVLDPRCAFVVKSSRYLDHRTMMGVTFRKDDAGNTYFTCFTKNWRFEIINLTKIVNGKVIDNKWNHTEYSGDTNPLGRVNIIEWIRDYDRMGCFERQMDEMNNLNLLISDFSNDVDQNTQAIWHGNDVDFPKKQIVNSDGSVIEVDQHPQTNEWVITQSTQDGRTPFIKPLAIDYDYTGILNQIQYRTNRIKEKCNVPCRNDNSGGSTGVAMDSATGWTRAEVEASRQDQIKDGCKMEEVKCVLAAIKNSAVAVVDQSLMNLRYMDVKPNIKRQKNYELTTKMNAFATGVSHGLAPEHMIPVINLFDDPNQVVADSKPYMDRYLASIYDKQNQTKSDDRLQADLSDQISNSPNIDGMRTGTDE